VFQFPGGGAQYPNMAKDLYATEAVFAREVDACLEILRRQERLDLFELLYPAPEGLESAKERMLEPALALPLLFTVEYALAKLWMSWGVEPSALIGHSMGEYTAACLAGVFSLETALSLVTLRGRLFEKLPEGGMTSVPLSALEVEPLMPAGLSFAAINGPTLCVASGPVEKLAVLESALAREGHEFQRIKIAVAAHSSMLEPILEEFRGFLRQVEFSPPSLPFVSNVSGKWIRPQEATSPDYWVDHLRNTVRYSDGLAAILEDPARILIEVGPGRVMTSLAGMHPKKTARTAVISSLRHPKEDVCDQALLLDRLGRVWIAGGSIDWAGFYSAERRRRVPLPTYSFDHQRHWIEPGDHILRGRARSGSAARKQDIAEWFATPSWRRAPRPSSAVDASTRGDASATASAERWLVLVDRDPLATRVVEELTRRGRAVRVARPGGDFAELDDGSFELPFTDADAFEALFARLGEDGSTPRRIVYALSLGTPSPDDERLARLDERVERSFHGLLALGQALGRAALEERVDVSVLTRRARQVAVDEALDVESSLVIGPCRVLPAEVANLACRSIDVDAPPAGTWKERRLVASIVDELLDSDAVERGESFVAYRGAERWIESFDTQALAPAQPETCRLVEGGVYVLTGGLGGIGSVLAEHLASRYHARLVLTSRTGLPDLANGDDWLSIQNGDDAIGRRVHQVRRLERLGAEVLVLRADVTSVEDMSSVVALTRKRFGRIDGVFHVAGVIDDALAQLKSRDDVERVLAPKVRGTLILDRVLRDVDCGFLLLFSSISSHAGLAGQIDYTSANAFLDAYARQACATGERFTIAVNWSAWSAVGMLAAASRNGVDVSDESSRAVGHPMLDRAIDSADGKRRFTSRWNESERWFLDEHRNADGTAFLPGTAYLEMTCAIAAECGIAAGVEIRDAVFLSPLAFAKRGDRDIEVRVEIDSSGVDVEVRSRPSDAGPASWESHYRARVADAAGIDPTTIDVASIRARCGRVETSPPGGSLRLRQEENLRLGARWRVLREVRLGAREGIAELELPDAFRGDLESFRLHPALLDMATAFGLPLLDGYEASQGLWVPLSYDRVSVYAGLPARVRSHVRSRGAGGAGSEMAVFDVDVCDERGRLLASIEGFAMVRVDGIASSRDADAASDAAVDAGGATTSALERSMLEPSEGLEVLERVLASDAAPQIVVANSDVVLLLRALREEAGLASASSDTGAKGAVSSQRPELSTPFVAAETEMQKRLLPIWREALGVEAVGIHDNFFELGGHSLLLTQMLGRIRALGGAAVTLRTLFERPTIASLADALGASDGSQPAAASASAIRRVSREKYRVSRSAIEGQ